MAVTKILRRRNPAKQLNLLQHLQLGRTSSTSLQQVSNRSQAAQRLPSRSCKSSACGAGDSYKTTLLDQRPAGHERLRRAWACATVPVVGRLKPKGRFRVHLLGLRDLVHEDRPQSAMKHAKTGCAIARGVCSCEIKHESPEFPSMLPR